MPVRYNANIDNNRSRDGRWVAGDRLVSWWFGVDFSQNDGSSVMRCRHAQHAPAPGSGRSLAAWLEKPTSGEPPKSRAIRSWLWLLIALVSLSAPAFATGTVRDVTLLPHRDGVRIVVDLGRKVPFEQRTFDGPPRLVLDLPDVSWQLPRQRGTRPYRFVKGFRFGQLQEGISRLVVDVDGPFKIDKVFELPPSDTSGYRIVTDLLPLPPGSAMRAQHMASTIDLADVETGARNGRDGFGDAPPRRPQAKPRATRRQARSETTTVRPAPVRLPEFRPGGIGFHLPAPRPRFSVAKRMIVLDPGHGGIDPGASGKRGTFEKNVVLNVALELRRQLLDTGRYDVVLTRGDDSFVRLRDRLQIARASEGHLFISLHADSLANAEKVRGAAVYTLSDQASSDEAARLAGNENRADILGGIDLSHHESIVTQILIDLAQRDANSKSLIFADLLVEELTSVTAMLRKRQQQAGFVVLKSPDMPSVLVELGYLSNTTDERRLNDPNHVADLAGAMIEAIDRYFDGEPS
jgi:N-acetylmuramoyl-L-alanine amidase